MASQELTVINGGQLEGGGQILRNAAALSCLLCRPIAINNIRAKRDNPGLRPQHLKGLEIIRDISCGKLKGGLVNSTEVELTPNHVKGGKYSADTKTAGSVCLLLQAALPCLMFADKESELYMRGGTNASMAPPFDYFSMVFGPIAERFGVNFECNLIKRGFYPKGQGEVVINTRPLHHLKAVEMLEPGTVTRITGLSYVAGVLPVKVAHRMAASATQLLRKEYKNIPVNIQVVKETEATAFGTGVGIIIVAETSTGCKLAGSALGSRGVPAEEVGETAANMLLNNLHEGGCVDEYLQDQLIILMALAKGTSRIKVGQITLHTETAMEIAKQLSGVHFSIRVISDTQNIIECTGIGLENKALS